mgnify:CR=1 FL=1
MATTILSALLPRLRPQLTHTLGVGGLIEAKRVLNAAIRAKEFLSSNDWLSAVLTIPEHCDEWLAAYFLRFHRVFCVHAGDLRWNV